MNIKLLFPVLSLLLLVAACSKDDNQPIEKPILSFLQQPAIEIDTVEAAVEWVYGFQFKVNGDGVINQIGMKLPVTGTFNATLWDLDTKQVLKEVMLTGNSLHEEVFEDINDIEVNPDMTLGVSIMANGFYKIKKTDNTPFAFPIQTSSITILSFHEAKVSELSGEIFALSTSNPDELSPCIDIVFIDQ